MRCERAEKSENDLKVELLLFLLMYVYCLFPEVSVLVYFLFKIDLKVQGCFTKFQGQK